MVDNKDLPQPQLPEDEQAKMDKIAKAATEATVARSKQIFEVIWRRVKEKGLDRRFPDMVENMDSDLRSHAKTFRPYILEDIKQPLESSEALRVAFVTVILDRERKYLEEETKVGTWVFPEDAVEVYEEEWAPVQETFMQQVFRDLPEYERGQALELADFARMALRYKVPSFITRPENSFLFYSAFKAGEIPPLKRTVDDAIDKAA